jgi:hypothetical protein
MSPQMITHLMKIPIARSIFNNFPRKIFHRTEKKIKLGLDSDLMEFEVFEVH